MTFSTCREHGVEHIARETAANQPKHQNADQLLNRLRQHPFASRLDLTSPPHVHFSFTFPNARQLMRQPPRPKANLRVGSALAAAHAAGAVPPYA